MSKKILLIVEGELEEPRILDAKGKGILNLISNDFQIFPYKTSIYDLYESYKNGEYDDIVSYLVNEKDLKLEDNEYSKTTFSAIYLVFDLDPHYHKYTDEIIIDLLNTFNNETELGKLYINYPMVESYYHIKSLNDNEYYNRTISLRDFNGKKYKSLVSKETCFNHKPIPRNAIQAIMKINYHKAELICNSDFSIEIDHKLILNKELEIKNSKNELYVLNTLSLLPIDYNPTLFISLIKTKH